MAQRRSAIPIVTERDLTPALPLSWKPYVRKPRVWYEAEVRAALQAVYARYDGPFPFTIDDYAELHDPWTEPHEDLLRSFGLWKHRGRAGVQWEKGLLG